MYETLLLRGVIIMIRKKILISLFCGLVISTGSLVYSAPYSNTISSLKKQVQSLQTQINNLQKLSNQKDLGIKELKKQIAEKDTTMKELRKQIDEKDIAIKEINNKHIVVPIDVKYSFDGVEVQGNYSDGTITVPQAFVYNGVIYSPAKLIASKLDKSIKYDEGQKIIYVDSNHKEQYMSDILTPMYAEGMYGIFSKDSSSYLTVSGKKYYKGYCMYPDASYKNQPGSLTFNLDGKYEKIKGKIGLQDGAKDDKLNVEVYGNNKLIERFQSSAGSQPLDFEIDVKGIYILKIVRYEYGTVDLVELVIK
jgi:hypothetical protein